MVERIGTFAERKQIQSRIDGLKARLRFAEERRITIDKDLIMRDIQNLERNLKAITPQEVSGADKDKMLKRAKLLAGRISDGMPTSDEMLGKAVTIKGSPTAGRKEDESIVQKHLDWQKRTAKDQQEYSRIMRQVDPNNEDAGSIELLRAVH